MKALNLLFHLRYGSPLCSRKWLCWQPKMLKLLARGRTFWYLMAVPFFNISISWVWIHQINYNQQVPLNSARVRVRAPLRVGGLQPGPVLGVDRVGSVGRVLGHVRGRRHQEEGAGVRGGKEAVQFLPYLLSDSLSENWCHLTRATKIDFSDIWSNSGYMVNFMGKLSLIWCKTDGINAHTIWNHILRQIQEEFKGVVT